VARAAQAGALVLAGGLAACGGPVCIEGVPCGPVPRYDENVPAAVDSAQRFAALALGNWHSCALDALGAAWCWGANDRQQLGASTTRICDDTVPCAHTPVPAAGSLRFASLTASHSHTCGLQADGQAWCWGNGPQLGDGVGAGTSAPVAVAGGHRFRQLSASLWSGETCGLKQDGSLWCWGTGLDAAAGPLASPQPQWWTAAQSVVLQSVGLGEAHACGLDANGRAWCWGRNAFGELGNGSGNSANTAQAVAGDRPYTQLSVGPTHACALQANGQAWCWGFNIGGDGSAPSTVLGTPVAVGGGLAFTQLASGQGRSCGLTADGSAWCWGIGLTGALGDGQSQDRGSPAAVTGGHHFQRIAAGGMATCGLLADGQAWCWGWNSVGALGRTPVAH
jgi:alpha-tubulin suppressor-like RCC1 family protein